MEVIRDYLDRIEHAVLELNGMAEALFLIGEAQRNTDDRDMLMFFAKACRKISENIDVKTA